MDRIDFSIDAVTWDDDQRLMCRGEPFTGEVVDTVAGQMIAQSFYVEGIPDGFDREWWTEGQLKSEGQMNHGRAVGIFRSWHVNGQLESEDEFSGDGTLLSRRKWDKDGNPIQLQRCRLTHRISDE